MYHSVTFYGTKTISQAEGIWSGRQSYIGRNQNVSYNTWTDWHLISASRPTIAHPEIETNYQDFEGYDGQLDYTEYVPGGIVYGDRVGALEFYVENDYEDWKTIRSKIIYALHGCKLRMRLVDDDPNYYYVGRFTFNDWKSEPGHSRVVINYQLEPYKYRVSDNTAVLDDL